MLSDIMFTGSEIELMETKNKQPFVFLQHNIGNDSNGYYAWSFTRSFFWGIAALVVNKTLFFEDIQLN